MLNQSSLISVRPGFVLLKKSQLKQIVKKETVTAALLILVLSGLWLFFNRSQSHLVFYLVDLPYFILFTVLIFITGIPTISQGLRYGTKSSLSKTVLFPIVLVSLYYLYLWIHNQPIMRGASLLLPYLVLFPVLALYHPTRSYKYVSWWDLLMI